MFFNTVVIRSKHTWKFRKNLFVCLFVNGSIQIDYCRCCFCFILVRVYGINDKNDSNVELSLFEFYAVYCYLMMAQVDVTYCFLLLSQEQVWSTLCLTSWWRRFTCAFSFFALYMMSTSLHGNRFLNFFLMALSELIPGFIFYILVDR